MQSMVPLGTRAPTNQITPIVPGEADDLTRARGRGRLWRLDGRAVDVLWIEMASARFEAVSRRIQKKFVNSASRILRESKILCGFFRGRRRNERERDRRPYIYMMEASSPFACRLVSCQFGKVPKKPSDDTNCFCAVINAMLILCNTALTSHLQFGGIILCHACPMNKTFGDDPKC